MSCYFQIMRDLDVHPVQRHLDLFESRCSFFFFLFSKSIFNMPGTEHLKKNSVLKS